MKVATNQQRLNELFEEDPRNDTAIADDLGVSKQAISAWRKGIRSPKKAVLIEIARKYHVSIEWLMGYDVEKDAYANRSFVIEGSQLTKLFRYMPQEDYKMIIDALYRAEKRMREAEGKKND